MSMIGTLKGRGQLVSGTSTADVRYEFNVFLDRRGKSAEGWAEGGVGALFEQFGAASSKLVLANG